MFDLPMEHLRTFVTIAEQGNYTRAAEVLHRTQPALSLQIKRLEEQLDTQLLLRNGRTTTVTEAGAMLLHYAQRILDLNEEAIAKLTAIETEGTVRVGILEEVALGPLMELLTKFGRLCSKIRIELIVSTSSQLAEQIARNHICLAVANMAYARGDVVHLWDEAYVWACHPDFEVPVTGALPLIVDPLSSPCSLRDIGLRTFDTEKRPWDIVFSSLSLKALQAAVEAGLGIGLLAESALPANLRILTKADGLPALPPASIGLYRSTDSTGAAADLLASFLEEHLTEHARTRRAVLFG